MQSVLQPTAVTESEFLSLPESLDKIELLDGEVIVSPSPSVWHQEMLQRFVEALRAWAKAQGSAFHVLQAPLDVRLQPGRIVQPDAMVFRGRIDINHKGPLDRVPVLCLEVLSSNRAYDRITKRYVYSEAGVEELWLVDHGCVEQCSDAGLSRICLQAERLVSDALPDLTLDLPSLLV